MSREEAERRRRFNPQITQISADSESKENNLRSSAKSADTSHGRAKNRSLCFGDLLDSKVQEFNPR